MNVGNGSFFLNWSKMFLSILTCFHWLNYQPLHFEVQARRGLGLKGCKKPAGKSTFSFAMFRWISPTQTQPVVYRVFSNVPHPVLDGRCATFPRRKWLVFPLNTGDVWLCYDPTKNIKIYICQFFRGTWDSLMFFHGNMWGGSHWNLPLSQLSDDLRPAPGIVQLQWGRVEAVARGGSRAAHC